MATFLGKSWSSCSSHVLSFFMFIPGLAFSYLKCVFQSGDYLSYNVTLAMTGVRHFQCTTWLRSSDNTDYEINPVFINRNPRCLEKQGLEPKRKGWKFQAPRQDYYNKLIFEPSKWHTKARVEHWTGYTIVEASTTDWSLAKHLYSNTDVTAASNVGRILARRCLEAGLTNVFYDPDPNQKSSKLDAFILAIQEGQITLREPKEVEHEFRPGIDYDCPPEYSPERIPRDDIQPVGNIEGVKSVVKSS